MSDATDALEQISQPEESIVLPTGEDLDLTVAQPLSLALRVNPDHALEQASQAARALIRVLGAKPHKVVMGGQQYLEYADWQTLGAFYQLSARVVSTEWVSLHAGDRHVEGFEAVAEVVTSDGRVVSRAEAMCCNDEEKWSSRPKYVYAYVLKSGGTSVEDPGKDEIVWEDNPNKPGKKRPQKVRELAGEDAVPVFQLRSMAQTRACAKALRNCLSWVAVLGGFGETPAEELDGMAERHPAASSQSQTPQASASAARQRPTRRQGDPDTRVISEAQHKRLWAIAREAGRDEDDVRDYVASLGYVQDDDPLRGDTSKIQRQHYEQVTDWLREDDSGGAA